MGRYNSGTTRGPGYGGTSGQRALSDLGPRTHSGARFHASDSCAFQQLVYGPRTSIGQPISAGAAGSAREYVYESHSLGPFFGTIDLSFLWFLGRRNERNGSRRWLPDQHLGDHWWRVCICQLEGHEHADSHYPLNVCGPPQLVLSNPDGETVSRDDAFVAQ